MRPRLVANTFAARPCSRGWSQINLLLAYASEICSPLKINLVPAASLFCRLVVSEEAGLSGIGDLQNAA